MRPYLACYLSANIGSFIQTLWTELKALNHVYTLSKRDAKEEAIQPAFMTSSSGYSTYLTMDTADSRVIDSLLRTMRNISLDDIQDISSTVSTIISQENEELELKIKLLNSAIIDDYDDIPSRPGTTVSVRSSNTSEDTLSSSVCKATYTRICVYCSRESVAEFGEKRLTKYTCALCKRKERTDKRMIQSKKLSNATTACDPPEKQGKFRSKLQTARDDIYFFDDM